MCIFQAERAKTRCDALYGCAESEFSRFFALCSPSGPEIRAALVAPRSFHTVCKSFDEATFARKSGTFERRAAARRGRGKTHEAEPRGAHTTILGEQSPFHRCDLADWVCANLTSPHPRARYATGSSSEGGLRCLRHWLLPTP